MKDHEISLLVNNLTEVARTFYGTQQLRQRIKSLVIPAIKKVEQDEYERLSILSEQQTGICLDTICYLAKGRKS